MQDFERNEVWAQGAEPGDDPIEVNLVPFNPEGRRKEAQLRKLEMYQRGDIPDPKTDELFCALLDVLDLIQSDEQQRQRGVSGLIRSSIDFILRRR